MLYVHSLMGDARPGELDPAPLGPAVSRLYERIAGDAERYHGPYRIESRFPPAARRAQEDLESRRTTGKLLLTIR